MVNKKKLYQIADKLRAQANLGIQYSQNEFDLERYRSILESSAQIIGFIEDRATEEVLEEYIGNLSHFSPLIGTDAFVMRNGKLLLIKRSDTGLWATPGGMSDVNETLAEGTARELFEETGLIGTPTRLLGVFDSRLWNSQTKSQLYHCVFEVDVDNEQIPSLSNETLDVGFFDLDKLPPISHGHKERLPVLINIVNQKDFKPYFDELSI